MTAPRRLQRKREAGWTTPLDAQGRKAIYVGRGPRNRPRARYGNPAEIGLWVSVGPTWRAAKRCTASTFIRTKHDAAAYYRMGLRHGGMVVEQPDGTKVAVELPSLQQIRDDLAGRDLMCWCGESDPCHGDTLLKVAAGEEP